MEQIADGDKLIDALRRLPGLGLADQLFAAHVLAVLARLGRAPEDALWGLWEDREWRDSLLLGLGEAPLDKLFSSLREIMLLRGDKWAWNTPHSYAGACEKAEAADRRAMLFSMVVLASLDAGSVSAVQRLLHGKLRDQLAPEVKYWRERFREVWDQAPAIVTAKWRAMMAALSIVPDVPGPPDEAVRDDPP
jgi:hypothetical protein